jgi:hypothetical protein
VGFFRLRYFYGKQLRLADYVDEQRYHSGKMRFHNDRLHGAGILCGLRVSLLDPDGLILRVGKGAALDDCGREIVVGYDQCVDVDGWWKAQKRKPRDPDEADPCHPDAEHRVRICVAVRYSECAQAPEPAPRNPCDTSSGGCGCGGGNCGSASCADPCGDGAEFGRVTEQFDLRLMFHDEARRLTEHRLFPSAEAIDDAVASGSGAIGLLQSLAGPIRAGCPGSSEEWLLLACCYAVVDPDDADRIIRIEEIDYDCASQVLLSTEVIQYLLANLFAEVDPGMGGPEIARVEFRRLSASQYQFVLPLTAPLDRSSVDRDSLNLRRLRNKGWDTPEGDVTTTEYRDAIHGERYNIDGPALYVTINNDENFLEADKRYHLFVPRDAHPMVDRRLRLLRPRDFTWRFSLEEDDEGSLVMVPPPHGKHS